MPSLRTLLSSESSFYSNLQSSTSSISSSPCDSPLKQGSNDADFLMNCKGAGSGLEKRLTRQRKLRHVTDAELGLWLSDRSRSRSVSPDYGSPRCPTHLAVPHPLPLPVSNTVFKPNVRSNSQSPEDGTLGSNPSSSATGRKITYQVAEESSKSPRYQHRGFLQDLNVERFPHNLRLRVPRYQHGGFLQDLNVERFPHNLRLRVPARSAPTSNFSSPAHSPQRFSSMDFFHSSSVIHQEYQVSSGLVGTVSNKLAGSPPQVISSRLSCTPDHSPHHSPAFQSTCHIARSATGVSFCSHHKSLPESSTGRPEGINHANLHPLPLPPGSPKPSQLTSARNIMEKQDVSSIKGQWLKRKLIGRGTYGRMFLAINRETGALCAMKEVDLIQDDLKSSESIKQLEQEIKFLQQIKHPNIVHYYGSEVVENCFCIYMEYVHPGSISKYLLEHCRAVTESIVCNFTRHILLGLACLHSKKTIHSNIKGANLLVDASGVVKLADIGMVNHIRGSVTDLSLKNSLYWMAPEVLQAVMRKDTSPKLDFAIDIWSLGCTVLEMLNGKPPWSEFNGVPAQFKVLNTSPPIPDKLSSEGKDFLRCCFQRNPADRPSAARLLEHPFLRHSLDQDASACTRELSGMEAMDTSHSPRDGTNHIKSSVPISPGTRNRRGKLSSDGENSPKYCHRSSGDETASPRSPHSTLEALPSISSSEFNCRSRSVSPSANSPRNLHPAAGNNNQYVGSWKGNSTPSRFGHD